MFGVLATIPSSTVLLATIGESSSPLFNELLPFGLLAAGLFLGVAFTVFLIYAVKGAFSGHKS